MSDIEKPRELELHSVLKEALLCPQMPLQELDGMLAPLPSLPDLSVPELPDSTPYEAPSPQESPVQTMPHGKNCRSVKISLRIDARTLKAFKARAAIKGRRYQRLINEVLRDTSASWDGAGTVTQPVDISV